MTTLYFDLTSTHKHDIILGVRDSIPLRLLHFPGGSIFPLCGRKFPGALHQRIKVSKNSGTSLRIKRTAQICQRYSIFIYVYMYEYMYKYTLRYMDIYIYE